MTPELFIAPAWFAAIPFVGLAILAIVSISVPAVEDGAEQSVGSRLWPALSAIMLILASACCLMGKYAGDLITLVLFSLVTCGSGIISARRDPIRLAVIRLGVHARIARDAICLTTATLTCLLALELPWNPDFPGLATTSLALEIGLIAALLVALFFLGQRTGALCGFAQFLACLTGLAQYFLQTSRDTALLPGDLIALRLAAIFGESCPVSSRALWGLVAGFVGFAVLSLLGPAFGRAIPSELDRSRDDEGKAPGSHFAPGTEPVNHRFLPLWAEVLINLAVGVAVSVGLGLFVTGVDFSTAFDIEVDYGKLSATYRANGFLSSFVAACQDLPIKRPEGFADLAAKEREQELAARYDAEAGAGEARTAAVTQFEEKTPSLVVVMDEAFADLSVFDQLRADYQGPTYFNGIGDALSRGKLAVSVLGDGACNTEFEFLTGNPIAFIGAGKYPYAVYDLSHSASLPAQLRSLGYVTSAIHPAEASDWHRDEVYPTLGFDNFYDIDEFEKADSFHAGISDAATFDKIIELLKLDQRPQFIFDVTIQNHAGYQLGDIPEDKRVKLEPGGDFTKEEVAELDEYLSCVAASDHDLEEFMGKLKALDRPVVLVYFGDYQPALAQNINDAYFPGEDEVDHQERTHHTSYLLWANYDVAGREQKSAVDDTSADLLAAMTLDAIGAPLTDLQKARLASRSGVTALNLAGYQGADRAWYGLDENSEYRSLLDDIVAISYLEFGSKVL